MAQVFKDENEARLEFVKNAAKYVGIKKTSNTTNSEHYIKVCEPYNAWLSKFISGTKTGENNLINGYPRNCKMYPDYAWCQCTASVFAMDMGLDMNYIPIEISCTKAITMWKKMGRWVEDDNYIPKPGDYIYYDWGGCTTTDSAGENTADHVGIVESVVGKNIVTIEGNVTHNGVSQVARENRTVGAYYICGYGIPDYGSIAKNVDSIPVKEIEVKREAAVSNVSMDHNVEEGSSEAIVANIQLILQKKGLYSGSVDSVFGPKTKKAVVDYQKKNNIVADGIVGPITMRYIINGV